MQPRWWLGFAAVLCAAVAACGSKDRSLDGAGGDPNGGPNGGLGGPGISTGDVLAVEPPDALLDVGGGMTPSLGYHAFVVHPDGSRFEATATAKFHVDSATYGSFSGATFTAATNGVGKTLVHADYGTLTGATSLSLRLTKTIVAGGAPADAPGKFGGGADPSRAPSVVYPPDGVMLPPNTNEIEWHWKPGAGTDVYELGVKSALLDLKVYFGCTAIGAGCGWSPDSLVWTILSNAGRGDDPLSYVLRGASTKGGGVGAAPPRTLAFGEEDIVGGLYYWNAGAGATMRYEFGVSGQKAETYMNAPKAGAATCVGCHVLSRDGSRISLGMDIPGPAAYKVFDVASRAVVFGSAPGPGANFFTFSPDNARILVSNGVNMSLRDAKTGASLVDAVGDGAMPDWSPDGSTIVFAKPKQSAPCFGAICGSPGVSEASLLTMSASGSGFGAPSALVASNGQNAYYPSFSPDGAWVIFNRASVGTDAMGNAKSSYDAADATVWAVSAKGGAPLALARAGSANGDSWPKWMQRDQSYRGRKLMWVTFSSRRAYGLRQDAGKTAQIWMAAFDPDAAAAGKDPSFAAFWLPFQDLASGNHIAQWVTKVERQGCTTSSQCDASESCVDSVCVPTVN